ncbi:MAG: NADH-quinone oxidoreductase subunit NuoE [Nanobdellota archaeon]
MVLLKKVSLREQTYYFLLHRKKEGQGVKEFTKYVGKKKPSQQELKDLKQSFLSSINSKKHDMLNTPKTIVEELQKAQEKKEYISQEDIIKISKEHSIPAIKIVETATFYSQFNFKKPGKHVIKVCDGTACHVKRSHELIHYLEKQLGIHQGQTTPDNLITLQTVHCIGACAKAPAMMVDDKVYGNLNPVKISKIVNTIKEQE